MTVYPLACITEPIIIDRDGFRIPAPSSPFSPSPEPPFLFFLITPFLRYPAKILKRQLLRYRPFRELKRAEEADARPWCGRRISTSAKATADRQHPCHGRACASPASPQPSGRTPRAVTSSPSGTAVSAAPSLGGEQ